MNTDTEKPVAGRQRAFLSIICLQLLNQIPQALAENLGEVKVTFWMVRSS